MPAADLLLRPLCPAHAGAERQRGVRTGHVGAHPEQHRGHRRPGHVHLDPRGQRHQSAHPGQLGTHPDVPGGRVLHHRRGGPDRHPADSCIPPPAGTPSKVWLARRGPGAGRKAERLDAPYCRRRPARLPVRDAHRHHSGYRTPAP